MCGEPVRPSAEIDGVDDVAEEREESNGDEDAKHRIGEWQNPRVVDFVPTTPDRAEALIGGHNDVAAVEWWKRQHVEDPDEHIEHDEQAELTFEIDVGTHPSGAIDREDSIFVGVSGVEGATRDLALLGTGDLDGRGVVAPTQGVADESSERARREKSGKTFHGQTNEFDELGPGSLDRSDRAQGLADRFCADTEEAEGRFTGIGRNLTDRHIEHDPREPFADRVHDHVDPVALPICRRCHNVLPREDVGSVDARNAVEGQQAPKPGRADLLEPGAQRDGVCSDLAVSFPHDLDTLASASFDNIAERTEIGDFFAVESNDAVATV